MTENPFKKGDRVELKPKYVKRGSRAGVVAREPKTTNLVSVRWDNNKPQTISIYHIDLLRNAQGETL